jgi:hypothetical protein
MAISGRILSLFRQSEEGFRRFLDRNAFSTQFNSRPLSWRSLPMRLVPQWRRRILGIGLIISPLPIRFTFESPIQ